VHQTSEEFTRFILLHGWYRLSAITGFHEKLHGLFHDEARRPLNLLNFPERSYTAMLTPFVRYQIPLLRREGRP
jgi:hypothetical protein